MKSFPKLIIALLMMLTSSQLFATAQQPDYLIFKGKKTAIHANPLSKYLQAHPEKKIKNPMQNSSCWRGYIATFEIKDKRLTIESITTREYDVDKITGELKSIETDITGEIFSPKDDRFCQWYTATLILPEGKMINYVHMGYASEFEHYTVIWIKAGLLINEKHFTLDEFKSYKRIKFIKFKQTPEYIKALNDSIKDGLTNEQAESFLFEFYTEQYLSEPE